MNEPDLFSDGAKPECENAARTNGTAGVPVEFGTRVTRSALWAAYGDALGWISELTDASGLKRRTEGRAAAQTHRVEASHRRSIRRKCLAASRVLFG